ncbi:MAG: molybdopterin-binding protein [Nitrospiraceae bacterium]|nr:molybdopterin-binding protein [Nitrospiraceae bacterium]
MCDLKQADIKERPGVMVVRVAEAVGMVLAHDITEVKKDCFKGRAFRKGHIIQNDDIERLRSLGKEHLYVLSVADDEMHEDDAAHALANALMGNCVHIEGEPKEGKINILASENGLLKINIEALAEFNETGEVMCATLHNNTIVNKDRLVAGTRAIPLVVKKGAVDEAVSIARSNYPVIEVMKLRKPRAGVVITGNEVYHGRIKDAFRPVIEEKIKAFDGEIVGLHYAPDDEAFIEKKLRELVEAGADLLITTGGMSVDPDDVTRFAIRKLGASDICYGASVLPGAMFLIAYLSNPEGLEIPVLGIPACGMYHRTTIFDLVLPRVLAGDRIGRKEIAQYGHGGLCLACDTCIYPHCPFGK